MTNLFPREGGCRCGRVRFRLTAPPLVTSACHCRGCQRMSSSAYSLSALMPKSGFERLEGETVIGGLRGASTHHFCAWCMSWMFSEPAGMDFVNVRATMLDDPEGFEPFIETQTAEKLSWITTPAAHSFERFPPMEVFGALIQAYAER